ncbi:hypothetical protein ESCO_004845 [Escovopsis weberi]|uniref:Tubulin-specific chaperone A n=1 Tax=Escovopsis weberi TaxID=150374 RepID=A0A0M8MZM5_ESCWE|nr:hypothetical protein ESCO_004845 [Escovopsis weberi]
MPAPSPLAIATGAVTRLCKEEKTYHKELADGEAQLRRLEEELRNGGADPDGNAEFMIKQQKLSVEQTQAVFGPLRERIEAARAKLVDLVEAEEKRGAGVPAELEKAKAALQTAKEALEKA